MRDDTTINWESDVEEDSLQTRMWRHIGSFTEHSSLTVPDASDPRVCSLGVLTHIHLSHNALVYSASCTTVAFSSGEGRRKEWVVCFLVQRVLVHVVWSERLKHWILRVGKRYKAKTSTAKKGQPELFEFFLLLSFSSKVGVKRRFVCSVFSFAAFVLHRNARVFKDFATRASPQCKSF